LERAATVLRRSALATPRPKPRVSTPCATVARAMRRATAERD
jgi:hypothetical protein